MQLVIIDTGCANINSVKFAIQRLGFEPLVSDRPEVIANADKLILPGVGSAQAAMAEIQQKQLPQLLSNLEQPLLGICLGMQLLCGQSEENNHLGKTPCLARVNAQVTRMQSKGLRLPHMGWNELTHISESPLFDDIPSGSYFYFVHSYSVPVGDYTLAQCDYGQAFSASIQQDNFYGVQFHPERSGPVGAKLLNNFIQKV